MKKDKSEVDYSSGMKESHCGPSYDDDNNYCQHYKPVTKNDGTCEKVAGAIKRTYWCRLFEKVT